MTYSAIQIFKLLYQVLLSFGESTVLKKMATGTFTHNIVSVQKIKTAHNNAQKSSKNFKPSVHNVFSTGTNYAKII